MARIESDSIGNVEIPNEALWGAQTQRSLKNFAISNDYVPIEIIHALSKIKIAAAIVNNRLGKLNDQRKNLIIEAGTKILKGEYDDQFPLKVWQTGSGTHTNMNINEVISNISSIASGEALGSHIPVHPNDHVNCSQSTNDTFPTAIHIASAEILNKKLLPELKQLIQSIEEKSNEWIDVVKLGRTHLQDAVPMTYGQEASAWEYQLSIAHKRLVNVLEELYEIPIGGTAIGTALNTPKNFDTEMSKEISQMTNLPFSTATNKFALMGSHDGLVSTMASIKLLAVALFKIVNDIRLLACGPRAGLSELLLPENEPGSSIMPGKINPSQCEAMAMVCAHVMGLGHAVDIAGSGGHLQMNVYKPLIGFNIISSMNILNDACRSCRLLMIEGIKINHEKIDSYLEQSLMIVTALNPVIGYDKAAEIAKYAYKKNITLREASNKLGYLSNSEFNKIVDPKKMAKPH